MCLTRSAGRGRWFQAAGVRLLKNQCSHSSTIGSFRLGCEPPVSGPYLGPGSGLNWGSDGRGGCHFSARIRGKVAPKMCRAQKDSVAMGPNRPNPSDDGARAAKRISRIPAETHSEEGTLRYKTLNCHGIRVKLKACPERGSYKSQANDLHRSCPNAHRPKHDRLFSRREQRQPNQQCSTQQRTTFRANKCAETQVTCASPTQRVRRECCQPAHA